MTTANLLASSVMDSAASLLNDTAKSTYTYTVQIPYLNMALRDLQESYELNNIPVSDETSAVINVPAGNSSIIFAPIPSNPDVDYLPSNLIEPRKLWERSEGIDPYVPMTRVNSLDLSAAGVQINQLSNYVWASQKIKFLPANQDNDIKMDYIRNLFALVVDEYAKLGVINAQSYLQYRTAAHVAKFVEENDVRAQSLNVEATISLDKALGIGTKGRQSISIRHRPFRASYKSRSYM